MLYLQLLTIVMPANYNELTIILFQENATGTTRQNSNFSEFILHFFKLKYKYD